MPRWEWHRLGSAASLIAGPEFSRQAAVSHGGRRRRLCARLSGASLRFDQAGCRDNQIFCAVDHAICARLQNRSGPLPKGSAQGRCHAETKLIHILFKERSARSSRLIASTKDEPLESVEHPARHGTITAMIFGPATLPGGFRGTLIDFYFRNSRTVTAP